MNTTTVNLHVNFGFLVGFDIATAQDKEEFGLNWGFSICLGIITISISNFDAEVKR